MKRDARKVDPCNFFSAGSPFLNHPLLTVERTTREVDFCLSQLGLLPGARILDVGCGPGRHTIELACRGFDVVGIDPSAAMIEAARARAAEAGVSPEFLQVGGESFTTDAAFDAAICLFTTLGQISRQGENSGLVRRVYDALHSGGGFIVETPQRDWTVQNLKTNERFGDGEHYTNVKRRYDAADRTISESFEVVSPTSTKTYRLRYRLYSHAELVHVLSKAGLSVLASFGDDEGNPLTPDSAMMLLIALK